MNDKNVFNEKLKVFYISKEEINSPVISEILKVNKQLKEKNILTKDSDAIFSIRFGKRMIINGKVKDIFNIKREELLEVVDYDAIRNNLLLIGSTVPKIETSLHWMIHHAIDDVNFIAQINKAGIVYKIRKKNITEVTDKYPIGSLKNIKEVLKTLRAYKKIIIKNYGLLIVGRNTADIEKHIQDIFGV